MLKINNFSCWFKKAKQWSKWWSNQKNVCDELVAKVNTTDNSGFVFKTKYGTNKSDLGKKTVMKTKKFLILEDLLKKKKQIIMLKLLK